MLRFDHPDGFQHPGHAERGGFAGQDRLGPRGRHEGLGREIVDLVGLDVVQQRDERELIEQITLAQIDPVLQVGDPLELIAGRAADHAHDLVALLQKEFRQVGPVLPRDAGNERASLGHSADSSRARANSVILFALCLLGTNAADAWRWRLRPKPWRGRGETEAPPTRRVQALLQARCHARATPERILGHRLVRETSHGGKRSGAFAHLRSTFAAREHRARLDSAARRGIDRDVETPIA